MDFRVKCAIQHVLSIVPGRHRLNYLMQRYVSKGLPRSEHYLDACRRTVSKHLTNYASVFGGTPRTVFEFGAGWDLCVPVGFSLHGCQVTASDVYPNARKDLIENILHRLDGTNLEELGLRYMAPCDTRNTGLPSASFDLVSSTDVLEHIAASHLPAVLAECRRLLSKQGICSFAIDYKDHWSRFDRSLPRLHFLRYSEREWSLYNPSIHYQNRLLHSDYEKLFKEAGFKILSEDKMRGTKPPVIAECFKHYGESDLTTYACWFVLIPQ